MPLSLGPRAGNRTRRPGPRAVPMDHSRVVENYRLAHAVADQQRRGKAKTEDLREAILRYRTLYEELLGVQLSSQVR